MLSSNFERMTGKFENGYNIAIASPATPHLQLILGKHISTPFLFEL